MDDDSEQPSATRVDAAVLWSHSGTAGERGFLDLLISLASVVRVSRQRLPLACASTELPTGARQRVLTCE